MASGAKPSGAFGEVDPRMTIRNMNVITVSQIKLAVAQIMQQLLVIHGAADMEPPITRLPAKAHEGARQERADVVAGNADAQRAARRLLGRDLEDLIVDGEKPARIGEHRLALARQHHAGAALVEQLGRKQVLQPLDLRTHRRLGEPERLGGAGEVLDVSNRDKGAQELDRDVDHNNIRSLPYGEIWRLAIAAVNASRSWIAIITCPGTTN